MTAFGGGGEWSNIHPFWSSTLDESKCQLHVTAAVPLGEGKSPQYPLNRRVSRPQNRSGRFGKQKCLTLPGSHTTIPRLSRPKSRQYRQSRLPPRPLSGRNISRGTSWTNPVRQWAGCTSGCSKHKDKVKFKLWLETESWLFYCKCISGDLL
jgi:hypothetical protein